MAKGRRRSDGVTLTLDQDEADYLLALIKVTDPNQYPSTNIYEALIQGGVGHEGSLGLGVTAEPIDRAVPNAGLTYLTVIDRATGQPYDFTQGA